MQGDSEGFLVVFKIDKLLPGKIVITFCQGTFQRLDNLAAKGFFSIFQSNAKVGGFARSIQGPDRATPKARKNTAAA